VYVAALENVCGSVAVPKAATGALVFKAEAAVGTTLTGAPKAVPFAENCTVPVGPAPTLEVATVAVSVTTVEVLTPDAGLAATPAAVGAAVTVIAAALDVLALKLLSPL
jgi:hypothetical protein